MKKHLLLIIAVALFVALALTSCDTATGQGAGWGATTGAILGAATTGRRRRSGGGRFDWRKHRGADWGVHRRSPRSSLRAAAPRWFPLRPSGGNARVLQSPYPPHQIYNLRHVPPGGLVEDRVGGGYFRKP